jgi:hypothetical protein
LYMASEPLAVRWHVTVNERKPALDFARFLPLLADDGMPRGADRAGV